MDQLHPWGSTVMGVETSLSLQRYNSLLGIGTKTHHIQRKVISVWLHTVIPPELSNIFFSQKVFPKQGKDKTVTVMILCETLRKDIFRLGGWFSGVCISYRANQNNKELGGGTGTRAHTQTQTISITQEKFPLYHHILQTASIFFYLHNQCERLQRRIYGAAWVSVWVALLLYQYYV